MPEDHHGKTSMSFLNIHPSLCFFLFQTKYERFDIMGLRGSSSTCRVPIMSVIYVNGSVYSLLAPARRALTETAPVQHGAGRI